MPDIIIVLQCLSQCLDKTTLQQLQVIVPAMLAMTGRVTMLGLSRWTDEGGSYRTIQRFYNGTIAWAKVNWIFIRHHLLDPTVGRVETNCGKIKGGGLGEAGPK